MLVAACPAAADQTATLGEAHTRILAPGVTATWYPHTTIAGYPDPTQLVTVTWPLGDPHYRMRTVATGGPILSSGFLPRRRMSAWGATQPRSLVAAISPDFATYHTRQAKPSGLEIARRIILHAPTGSVVAPSVGYTRDGRLVFGSVRTQPLTFQLPDGHTATVEAMNAAPTTNLQVGAYPSAGARVKIPQGDRAVILTLSPFATSYRAPAGVTSFAGQPAAYALHQTYQPVQFITSPIRRPRPRATRVIVPPGGAVLLMRALGGAAAGFNLLLTRAHPQVHVNVTDSAWASVTDVMGGKPILIRNGAVTAKPATMTNYQWTAPVSRIALGETADGQGIIAILNGGNRSTAGVDAPRLAATLVQLGVTNAIAFDAGPVPEIYSPRYRNGTCFPNHGWCYQSTKTEWSPPLASALYHTP
jgi:hypothetical protein